MFSPFRRVARSAWPAASASAKGVSRTLWTLALSAAPLQSVDEIRQQAREEQPRDNKYQRVRSYYHEYQCVLDNRVADGKIEQDEEGLLFSDVCRSHRMDDDACTVSEAYDDPGHEGD